MEYEKIDPTCMPSSENDYECPTVDPKCEDMSEINKWLSTKTAHFRVINRQIDFNIKNNPIRESELWLPSFSLKSGLFTDCGYRYKENNFYMEDSWVPGVLGTKRKFYEIIEFNTDVLQTTTNFKYVAQIYFRLAGNKLDHQRVVFQFKDWLASIAGIERLLLRILTFVYGGYAQFNSSIEIINE